MAKFRYSINTGSGYSLVDVYENQLKLKSFKKYSKAIETKELSGSISFVGTLAKTIFDERTTGYLALFKIEEYNGVSWNDLHICQADIRGKYQRLQKIMTIDTFSEVSGYETQIMASINSTYKTNDLGISTNAIVKTYTSVQLDILGEETALDKDAYILAYDTEGNADTVYDSRWDYFRWFSTIGVTPNLQHVYSTRRFDSKPLKNGTSNDYEQIQLNSTYYWVKYPPTPYTEESWADVLMQNVYRLDYVLDAIVDGINGSLSFDAADQGDTNMDADRSYLGDGNEFDNKPIEGINFTLKKLFDFWLNYYNVAWYIDSTKLKFLDNPYKHYNDSLDWSTETANFDDVESIEMPDTEIWKFGDDSMDRCLLSYFDKGTLTKDNTIDYTTDIMHDMDTLRNGGYSQNKLIWVTVDGSTVFYVKTPTELFNLYSLDRCFSEYAPYFVSTDPADSYTAVTSPGTQPIYRVKHEKWIDDYTAFDLFSRITIAGTSNIGYLDNYVIDMNTGLGTFEILFDTLTL